MKNKKAHKGANKEDGTNFMDLPMELHSIIISFMDGRTLLRFSMVNSTYADLCGDEKLWFGCSCRERISKSYYYNKPDFKYPPGSYRSWKRFYFDGILLAGRARTLEES